MLEVQQKLKEKLSAVLEETFENMAFISIEEVDKDQLPIDDVQLLEVRLMVTTPVLMEVYLILTDELLRQVVETMYTIDADEITDEQIQDVLSETLNTFAGLLMTELLPADQAFSLSLPEMVKDDSSPDENSDLTAYYLADDQPAIVKISSATPEELKTLFNN